MASAPGNSPWHWRLCSLTLLKSAEQFYQRAFLDKSFTKRTNMDRRGFPARTTSTVLAGATLVQQRTFAVDQRTGGFQRRRAHGPSHQSELALQQDFCARGPMGGSCLMIPDSICVVIPHTNIRLPWHSFDLDKTYEFVSIYRRRCSSCHRRPAEKHVFVDFEGGDDRVHGVDQRRKSWRIQRRIHAVFLLSLDPAHRFLRRECFGRRCRFHRAARHPSLWLPDRLPDVWRNLPRSFPSHCTGNVPRKYLREAERRIER